MTLEQAGKFIIDVVDNNRIGIGKIYIKKMPAVRIIDLAHAISENADIEIVGKHKIEKTHEVLLTEEELENAYENKEMIVLNYASLTGFKKVTQPYSSDKAKLLTIDEIKKLL